MTAVIKIIQITGALFGASGLIGLLIGYFNFQSGTKNEDPMKAEKGSHQMLWGGASAMVSTGVVAIIVSALNAIRF